jgi:hypothetical protein
MGGDASDYIPLPNPDVICQEEEDGWIVLVNMDTGHALALNRTGAFIWKCADGKKSVGQIIAGIKAAFSGVPDDLDNGELLDVVNTLKENGFFGHCLAESLPAEQQK